jgi:hypothetical protein
VSKLNRKDGRKVANRALKIPGGTKKTPPGVLRAGGVQEGQVASILMQPNFR